MTDKQNERPAFDLHRAFINKQVALKASFLAIRDVTSHGPTQGDVSEGDWTGLIRDFLPTRYEVGPIFAVDHHGGMSDQIDVAVYDKHYSPQWFGGANNVRFVPVESVYAVFEIKPELNAAYVQAAIQKVTTVRNLDRTSAPVVHKGGKYEPAQITLSPIIGGILATRNGWHDALANLDRYQPAPDDPGFLNIGIALDDFCFDYTPTLTGAMVTTQRTTSDNGQQLIHFAIRLFRQLQAIGTVPAVDMEKYEQKIQQTGAADSGT
ncbi:DUF6602 domain-containing protein [Kribbella sp. NPDC055071]